MSDLRTAASDGAAAPPAVVNQPPPRDKGPSFKVTDEISAGKAISALVLDDDLKLPDPPPSRAREQQTQSDPREPPPAQREPDDGAAGEPPTVPDQEPPDEGEDEQPPAAAIEPPKSWPADEIEHFRKLPPELQQYMHNRESQREAFIAQRAQEASENKRAAEAARTEAANHGAAYLDGLSRMRLMLLPEIQQLAQVDWVRLQAENQPEFARLMQMREVLGQRVQLVDQVIAQEQQSQAQQRVQAFVQRQEAERAELHRKIPDMQDPVRREAIRGDLVKYLHAKGFNDDELAVAIDHRVIDVAYDALRWQQQQAARQAAEERRNNPAPALQRSGSTAPASRESAGQARFRQAAQQLGRTHSERDAGKLLALLM